MTIIELCGPPGAGKSTLSKALYSEISNQGKRVCDIKKYYINASEKKDLKKLLEYYFYRAGYRGFSMISDEIKRLYSISDKNTKDRSWIDRVLFSIYVIHRININKYDYMICDETFLQNITSIFHYTRAVDDDLKVFCKCVSDNIYGKYNSVIVRCRLAAEQAAFRIKERNRSGDRFNSGNDEEMKRLIEKKDKAIDLALQYISNAYVIDVDTYNAKEALKEVLEQIQDNQSAFC